MTQITIALHDTSRKRLDTEAAKLHRVFSGVDVVVLFGAQQELLPSFARLPVVKSSDESSSIAIATRLVDVSFCVCSNVCRKAQLLTLRAFSDENADTVRLWLEAANCNDVAAFVIEDEDVGVVAWQSRHATLDDCPGGYATFSAVYASSSITAFHEMVPDAAWRFAGNLEFESMAEGAAAHRYAAELGITLFNSGTSRSTWFPALLVRTAAFPDRPSLCFGSLHDESDTAGSLVAVLQPPSAWWPWHQIPVYIVLNRSLLHQLALWFVFLGSAIMVSAVAFSLAAP